MTTTCYASSAVAGLSSQISLVNGQVIAVQGSVTDVSKNVREVGHLANATANRLEQLWELFVGFIDQDRKAKSLQLAETRLIKIRQEVEKLFGVRDLVRNRMLGLLQADDLQLIRKDTSLFLAEQTMVDAPSYWLAPALIGFAGWICDDEKLSAQAFDQMMKRDPVKGRLFLALLLLRAGRDNDSSRLISEYLAMHHPEALNRETITLIDSASNGLLPQTASQSVLNQLNLWMDELKTEPAFDEQLTSTWIELLSRYRKDANDSSFPYLKKYASNWAEGLPALSWSDLHHILNQRFNQLFNAPVKTDLSVKEKIDGLLERLIEDYEADESELRIDEMLNSAIVELDGERDTALSRINAFRLARSEQLSVGELLAVATSDDTQNHASVATRKLATFMSSSWIQKAIQFNRDMVHRNLLSNHSLNIDGFTIEIAQNSNQDNIALKQVSYYDGLEKIALHQAKWTSTHIGMLIAGVVAFAVGAWGVLGGLCLIAYSVYSMFRAAARVKAAFIQRRATFKDILQGSVMESRIYWSKIVDADQVAVNTMHFLSGLNADQLGQVIEIQNIKRLAFKAELPQWVPKN